MLAAAPTGVTTALWRHQQSAVDFARDRQGTLLAMSMGHGKSLVVLALLEAWDASRVLILCPKSVVAAWPEQFRRHVATPWTVAALDRGTVEQRSASGRQALTTAPRGCVVVNYEAAIQPAMRRWLLTQAWDVVVFDESHRLKHGAGVTSRLCRAIGERARRRLALTGTPMPHSPLDIHAQARAIGVGVYGQSWIRFRTAYAITDPIFPKRVLRYQHLDDLERKLATFAYRSPDDAVDLPPATHVTRTGALSAAARSAYRRLERDFTTDLEAYGRGDATITAANILVKLLRLQSLTSGFLKDDQDQIHEVDGAKAALLAEVLDEIRISEPIVVFARFRHDLDVIRRVAEASGRASAELSGRVNALATWQRPDGPPVLAVQTQSGGVGISLVRARYCVYYSKSYSLGEHQQSLARCLRPGQDRPVVFVHLLIQDTIDETIEHALNKKEDLIRSLLASITSGQSRQARG